MERRALLAAVLSIAVIMLWQYLFMPPLPPPAPEALPGDAGSTASDVGSTANNTGTAGVGSTSAVTAVPDLPGAPGGVGSADSGILTGDQVATADPVPSSEPELERVTASVKSPRYEAVFSSEGGGIQHFWLKDYRPYSVSPGVTDLVKSLFKRSEGSSNTLPAEMDLFGLIRENALTFELQGILPPDTRFKLVNQSAQEVVFERQIGSLYILKRYSLRPDDYMIGLSIQLENRGSGTLSARPDLTLYGQHLPEEIRSKSGYAPNPSPVYFVDDSATHLTPDDIEEEVVRVSGVVEFMGVDDPYFLRALLPATASTADLEFVKLEGTSFKTRMTQGALTLQPGQSQTLDYLIFAGPKRSEVLASYDRHLEKSLNFGFFSLFAEPLLWFLKRFYSLVGSYGVAIILLTLLIKTLFYPLFVKQIESGLRMKEFQPQMNSIRERFKDDKNRQNQEMMRFMQENRINPLGGCLPMLLQMPIWFALYQVLQYAIELYHTPFLYLPDLSAQDPYGISPLLLGILMYVQQKLTPMAPGMDPVQAKMLQYMPLIFSVIMFTLPSGLVVYILVNTILTILQQWYVTRKSNQKLAQARAGARG